MFIQNQLLREKISMQEIELLDLIKKSATYSSLSSIEENKVIDYLRTLPELEAYIWLERMKTMHSNITLSAATRILRNNKLVEEFFRNGVLESDASTIKFWLGFAIPKLGTKAVIRILSEYGKNDKVFLNMALYWLPLLIKNNEQELLVPLKSLAKNFND
jgi:hypothetical protein